MSDVKLAPALAGFNRFLEEAKALGLTTHEYTQKLANEREASKKRPPTTSPKKGPEPVQTSPTMSFVILDHSTKGVPGLLLTETRDAWNEYLNGAISDHYGGTYQVRIGANAQDRKSNEQGINIRDSLPDAPGALAFHYAVNGIPDIEIGLEDVDLSLDGPDSLSAVGAHELAETVGDAGANEWCELQDGSATMRARELCDRVQNTSFKTSKGASVSNFLLPNAFIPGSKGPWDYVSLSTGKSIMADQNDYSNGYDIEAGAPTDENQLTSMIGGNAHVIRVLGKPMSTRAMTRKRKPHSRTSRRGARVES